MCVHSKGLLQNRSCEEYKVIYVKRWEQKEIKYLKIVLAMKEIRNFYRANFFDKISFLIYRFFLREREKERERDESPKT